MGVQLAMYKGKGDIFNRLIRWWTGSQYSHCELVVRGTCYSSSVLGLDAAGLDALFIAAEDL